VERLMEAACGRKLKAAASRLFVSVLTGAFFHFFIFRSTFSGNEVKESKLQHREVEFSSFFCIFLFFFVNPAVFPRI